VVTLESVRQIVQKKHRIVISRKLREALGIREGDEVELKLEKGHIIIRPIWLIDNPTESLSGLVKSEEPLSPEKIEEEIYRERVKKASNDTVH